MNGDRNEKIIFSSPHSGKFSLKGFRFRYFFVPLDSASETLTLQYLSVPRFRGYHALKG